MGSRFWIIGVIGVASMSISPCHSADAPRSLRPITGAELENLVVGSTMGYGDRPIKGGGFYLFSADHHYKFFGSEVWSEEGSYRVEHDQICSQTSKSWCFKVFIDKGGRYYILESTQPPNGYQLVRFAHIKQK